MTEDAKQKANAGFQAIMKRRTFLGAAIGAGVAGGLLARGGAAWASETRGGVLNQLLPWEPNSLSLLSTADSAIASVTPKIVEGLIDFDLDMNPLPALATEWAVSEDGLTYTFKLRENVKWHDGEAFVADDVVTSIRILSQHNPRGRVTFANMTSVEAVDPLTVRLTLAQPVPYLLTALMAEQSPIVPSHLYDAEANPAENPANNAPVGTGPFRFVEWQRGSYIRLVRNDEYWDEGLPHLTEVYMKVVPDLGARSAAFETGQVNLGGDSPLALAEIKRFEELDAFTVERRGYSYSPSVISLFFNLERDNLKDVRVRQAIAHVIDPKIVLDLCWLGYGFVAPSPISPELTTFFSPDVTTYPLDEDKARSLLSEAGFGEGGQTLTLDLVFSTAQTPDLATGNYIRQALAKIGINVNLQSHDQPAFTRRVFTDRDFDLMLAGYNNGADPTIGVQRAYWSKTFQPGVPYSNGSAYSNPRVDELLEAAAVEPDLEKRKAMFLEFQQIITRDLPGLPLVSKQSVTIVADNVRDHTVSACGPKGNFARAYVSES